MSNKLGIYDRHNMFLATSEIIHHGGRLAKEYPRIGDFAKLSYAELNSVCIRSGVDPEHVRRALKGATGYDLLKPDLDALEAFVQAEERLALDAGLSVHDAWPLAYRSPRWPGNVMA